MANTATAAAAMLSRRVVTATAASTSSRGLARHAARARGRHGRPLNRPHQRCASIAAAVNASTTPQPDVPPQSLKTNSTIDLPSRHQHDRHHNDDGSSAFVASSSLLGGSSSRPISKRWLRDQCKCTACFDAITKQRNLDIFTLDQQRNLRIDSVQQLPEDDSVSVTWVDGHESNYSRSWLHDSLATGTSAASPSQRVSDATGQTWLGWDRIADAPPAVQFEAIMATDQGLLEWLSIIRKHGFCFVDGCPEDTAATRNLIERIGPLTNTHYGQFHEMTANLSSKDTAYTEVFLPPHNDTTYFTAPIGLQMLHLLHHRDGTGGESQLVDGFAAAQRLAREDPDAFDVLCNIKITAHASGNEDVALEPTTPISVLNLDPVTDQLVSVRWNPADRLSVVPRSRDSQAEDVERWYAAAEKLQRLLYSRDDPAIFYQFRLQPGRPVMFNNWRLLHGRNSFTGSRRMCGGYVDQDYFRSRERALRRQLGM